MKNLDLIFGRTGNRMFQMAALMSFAHQYNNGDIFFTDPKWFTGRERELQILYGDGILNQPAIDKVAVHIRRGDFMRPPQSNFHANLCLTDYYEQAVKIFPGATFLVFCANGDPENDVIDQQWCRDYFTKLDVSYEIGNTGDGIADMNLMARCRHQIIANSSFSWWAAFLNPNPDKVVVCAEETAWCCDKIPRIRVPITWKQLKVSQL